MTQEAELWVWLDDERPAPPGWFHVKTAYDAIAALESRNVIKISLDHDLGGYGGSGYDVACWIEWNASVKNLPRLQWAVHSANPVGRQRMTRALENADKIWDRRQTAGG